MGGRETLMHDQLMAAIVRPTCFLCLGVVYYNEIKNCFIII